APIQVVIVPIYRNEEQREKIALVAQSIVAQLEQQNINVQFDNRDTQKPGWKFAQHEIQGVPVRIAIGPKDLEKGTVEIARRDTLEKEFVPQEQIQEIIPKLMKTIQKNLF